MNEQTTPPEFADQQADMTPAGILGRITGPPASIPKWEPFEVRMVSDQAAEAIEFTVHAMNSSHAARLARKIELDARATVLPGSRRPHYRIESCRPVPTRYHPLDPMIRADRDREDQAHLDRNRQVPPLAGSELWIEHTWCGVWCGTYRIGDFRGSGRYRFVGRI